MKISETRLFRGPNLYSLHHTVIRITLDLEELEEYPSDRLPDFTDRLIAYCRQCDRKEKEPAKVPTQVA